MRPKFLVGGLIILAAVIYLIVSATQSNAEYFLTVRQVREQGEQAVGRNLRVSGAVIGDTIQYDAETLSLRFDIADIPGDNAAIEAQGGLAEVLHQAVLDPTRPRLTVVYVGPRPDLLQNEAQAIVTGRLGEDGIFYADEVLLKCPTRYEESLPGQAGNE